MKLNFNKTITLFFLFIFLVSFNTAFSQAPDLDVQAGNIEVLKFKDANITTVIRSIAAKAYRDGKKVNIVIGSDVTGTVTIDLEDVSWTEAFKVVLRSQGYGYEWVGDYMILISTPEKIAKRREKEMISREMEEIQTEVFNFSFAKVEEVGEVVKQLLTERGRMTLDKRTNTIIIADIQSNLESIRNDIKSLDAITPQVLIEARVIETNLDITKKLGVKWNVTATASGAKRPHIWPFTESSDNKYLTDDFPVAGSDTVTPASPFAFGTLDASNLSATLDLILSDSDTTILSQPKIMTTDNSPASIKVVTEDPVPKYTYSTDTNAWEISGFEYMEYGIFLDVTPQINKEGFITLKIEPKVSDSTSDRTFVSASGQEALIPIIQTRTTSTTVMIKDNQTLVIGGLIKDRDIDTITKVPLLGDIPVLGWLFKHKNKTKEKVNLLIFITPKIMTLEKAKSDE